MSEWLNVNETYRDVLARAGLATFDGWMNVAPDDERGAGRQETFTRFDLSTDDGFGVYLKRFRPDGPSLRFPLRRSRQRCEAESGGVLSGLGVPTAEVLAAGERRRFGCVTAAFVATREIPGAVSMTVRIGTLRDMPRRAKTALIEQLACIVRRMHDGGFIDHDLYLRNVLVRETSTGTHEVFLIDSPRGGLRRFGLRRGKVRDLACLDRDAAGTASRIDRVRFLRAYLKRKRLERANARLVRDIETCLSRKDRGRTP